MDESVMCDFKLEQRFNELNREMWSPNGPCQAEILFSYSCRMVGAVHFDLKVFPDFQSDALLLSDLIWAHTLGVYLMCDQVESEFRSNRETELEQTDDFEHFRESREIAGVCGGRFVVSTFDFSGRIVKAVTFMTADMSLGTIVCDAENFSWGNSKQAVGV